MCVTGSVAVLCILAFRGSMSRVVEQLCICLSQLKIGNICMQRCIVKCASRLFEPMWPGQSEAPLFLSLSLSASPISSFCYFPPQHCCLEKLSSLCTLCRKTEWSKGAHRGGEGERATDCSYCLRVRLAAS